MINKEDFINKIVDKFLYYGFNTIDYWDGADLFWDRIDGNLLYDYEKGHFPPELVGKQNANDITEDDIKKFLEMYKENEEEITETVNEAIHPNNLQNTWNKYRS